MCCIFSNKTKTIVQVNVLSNDSQFHSACDSCEVCCDNGKGREPVAVFVKRNNRSVKHYTYENPTRLSPAMQSQGARG